MNTNFSAGQRKVLFYTICLVVRTLLGLLFWLEPNEVTLHYFLVLWGGTWLVLSLMNKRWDTNEFTPPWWSGNIRILYRFLFSFVLVVLGIVGISTKMMEISRATAVVVWVDVVISFINYTFLYTI